MVLRLQERLLGQSFLLELSIPLGPPDVQEWLRKLSALDQALRKLPRLPGTLISAELQKAKLEPPQFELRYLSSEGVLIVQGVWGASLNTARSLGSRCYWAELSTPWSS
jgi:hypothetical protein